jgi:hypothetical protein
MEELKCVVVRCTREMKFNFLMIGDDDGDQSLLSDDEELT